MQLVSVVDVGDDSNFVSLAQRSYLVLQESAHRHEVGNDDANALVVWVVSNQESPAPAEVRFHTDCHSAVTAGSSVGVARCLRMW